VSDRTYRGTAVSYGKVVPLISSYTAGPLGLIHLPRLWLKALLLAHGTLAEDWGCGPGGLDKRIMAYVGIDGNAFLPWLTATLPTYAECESWVREHATNLTPSTIAESNDFLLGHPLPQGLGPLFRAHLRLADETLNVGIMLNNYDDWDTLHRYLETYRGRPSTIVPAVGPEVTGASGLPQLPRLWAKTMLEAFGALPDDYAFIREALDDLVLDHLGIEGAAAREHLVRELPTYVDFEAWIKEKARSRRAAGLDSRALPELARDAVAAVHDYDWTLLHASITGRATTAPRPSVGILAFETTPMLER
jgi:hypothetical protein